MSNEPFSRIAVTSPFFHCRNSARKTVKHCSSQYMYQIYQLFHSQMSFKKCIPH